MELINYALLSFVSYLGIFFGGLLVFIAPEEQKPGKKYFLLIQKIIIGLIIIFLLYNFSIINLFISILLFSFFMSENIGSYFAYILFAPILYIGLQNTNLKLIIPTSIFLYGLSTGSLVIKPKHSFWELKKGIIYLYYPILALLIFLLQN